MLTNLTHITIFVKNQDEAMKFYVEKLGFKVHTDAMFGPMRWLTLCLPSSPTMEFCLMVPSTPAEQALVGKQNAGQKPLMCFQTNDCAKDFQLFKSRGVKFLSEPTTEPWGIAASMQDLYGNVIYIVQDIPTQTQKDSKQNYKSEACC